jgi:hypothetical protein
MFNYGVYKNISVAQGDGEGELNLEKAHVDI